MSGQLLITQGEGHPQLQTQQRRHTHKAETQNTPKKQTVIVPLKCHTVLHALSLPLCVSCTVQVQSSPPGLKHLPSRAISLVLLIFLLHVLQLIGQPFTLFLLLLNLGLHHAQLPCVCLQEEIQIASPVVCLLNKSLPTNSYCIFR